jgi:hypothetical protein
MCLTCSVAYATGGVSLLLVNSGAPLALATTSSPKTISSQVQSLQELPSVLETIKVPSLEEPAWLKAQNAAEAAAAAQAATRSSVPVTKVVTYDVTSRGAITSSMAEFRTQANATLNDGRGWARLGVSFQEVASGGMFTLVLSEASQVTSFSSGCGEEYSCRVGRYVIINQDRWAGATPSWNEAGGSIRDYRHMVVNHETGHWLGHDHATCGGAGQAAPVMQQQSINLKPCSFNPWPIASELWSTQLGIRRS